MTEPGDNGNGNGHVPPNGRDDDGKFTKGNRGRPPGAKDKRPRAPRGFRGYEREMEVEERKEIRKLAMNAMRLLAMMAFEKGEFDPNVRRAKGEKPLTIKDRLRAAETLVIKGLPDIKELTVKETPHVNLLPVVAADREQLRIFQEEFRPLIDTTLADDQPQAEGESNGEDDQQVEAP